VPTLQPLRFQPSAPICGRLENQGFRSHPSPTRLPFICLRMSQLRSLVVRGLKKTRELDSLLEELKSNPGAMAEERDRNGAGRSDPVYVE